MGFANTPPKVPGSSLQSGQDSVTAKKRKQTIAMLLNQKQKNMMAPQFQAPNLLGALKKKQGAS